MKKRIIVIVVMVCVCSLFASVYLHKVSNNKSAQNKWKALCDWLSQTVEDQFTSIDEIESANAIVNYDEMQNQYSIELSLITDEDINEEQVELYKRILRKNFVEVKLTINGELR